MAVEVLEYFEGPAAKVRSFRGFGDESKLLSSRNDTDEETKTWLCQSQMVLDLELVLHPKMSVNECLSCLHAASSPVGRGHHPEFACLPSIVRSCDH